MLDNLSLMGYYSHNTLCTAYTTVQTEQAMVTMVPGRMAAADDEWTRHLWDS